MRISVIIPTHNRRTTLPRALSSVAQQHLPACETIVVDDASTDGTATLPHLTSQPHIRYVSCNEHRGVAAARNTGVAHARAEWIAFLDSDDQWHPDKLQRQVAWLHAHPQYRICQTREIWIRNGTRVNPPHTHEKRHGDIFEQSLQRCMITPSSVVMQKSLFERAGGFNEALPVCEDYDLWLRISASCPIGLVDAHLMTRYGGHTDQLSYRFAMQDRFRIRSMLDLLRSGSLTPQQRTACVRTLRRKAMIVANGSKKRGKEEEYAQYRRIAHAVS
jgi:glycosyltransferase involved in cell wall biosynthesis